MSPPRRSWRSSNRSRPTSASADYLYGCYECGICVGACPSAKFYDFSPRRIAQAAAARTLTSSTSRCRRTSGSAPSAFLPALPARQQPGRAGYDHEGGGRAQRAGLGQASPRRLLPDHLQDHVHRDPGLAGHAAAGRFPRLGPGDGRRPDHLDLWRRALPAETMHTTTSGGPWPTGRWWSSTTSG